MNLTAKKLVWMKFWKLTILEGRWSDKRYNRLYLCRCDCWWEKIVRWSKLRQGEVKSCWCAKKTIKHWMYGTRLNRIYRWVRDRCLNKNAPAYKYYWWRGIECCRKDFESFFKDMTDSYKTHVEKFWEKETTIDRINNNWDYCKDNCKWSTPKEQAINRRKSIDYDWYNTEQIEAMTGVAKSTIRKRILSWLPKEKVFHKWNIVSRKRSKQFIVHNGEELSPRGVAEVCNISESKTYSLFKKWCKTIEEFKNSDLKIAYIEWKGYTATDIKNRLWCSKTRSYVIFRQMLRWAIPKAVLSLLTK